MGWRRLVPVIILVALIAGTLVTWGDPSSDGKDSSGLSAFCPSTPTARVASFDWGFVVLRNESEVRNVPFVKLSVDPYGKTNVSTGNVTAKVPVMVLMACSYDGKLLWNLTLSGYLWVYDGGKYNRYNGTALPEVLVANTSDYLYVLVYQTAPREFPDLRGVCTG